MRKGKLWITLGVLLGFVLICIVILNGQVEEYIDTHTWATVTISGLGENGFSDDYNQQKECRKGDRISIGNVTLLVENVTHKGTVSFSVKQGEFTDESGNVISKDELILKTEKNYRVGNDVFSLCVTSNRYE